MSKPEALILACGLGKKHQHGMSFAWGLTGKTDWLCHLLAGMWLEHQASEKLSTTSKLDFQRRKEHAWNTLPG